MGFLNNIDMQRIFVIIWEIISVICLILSTILIYEMKTTYSMTKDYPVIKQNLKTENVISYDFDLNNDLNDF